MINEKILINYLNKTVFNNIPTNVIGATTNQTLRTVESNNDSNTKYVRKFGKAYKITNVVTSSASPARSDGGGVNQWKWELRGADTDTLMGTITDANGSSSYVDGSTLGVAEQLIIKLVWISGTTSAIVDGDFLLITTDIDLGGKTWQVSKELLTAAGSIILYASDAGSTYYDVLMVHGGFRRVADGTNTTFIRAPFYNISTAYAALGGAFDKVVILDSETYDEEVTLDTANTFLFSALGETPTIASGIGARVTREVQKDGNNFDTIYVDKTGNDSTGDGTFQNPVLTIQKAIDLAALSTIGVNIKDSNSYSEDLIVTVAIRRIEAIYGQTPTLRGLTSLSKIIDSSTIPVGVGGIRFENGSIGINLTVDSYFRTVSDCTFKSLRHTTSSELAGGIVLSGKSFTGIFEKNICDDCGLGSDNGGGILLNINVTNDFSNGDIRNNICFNGARGIEHFSPGGSLITNNTITMENNLCYGNIDGIRIEAINGSSNLSQTIKHNTLTRNTGSGIKIDFASNFQGTISDLVSFNNTTLDLEAVGGGTPTITESDFLTNTGFTSGSGNISTDPNFCKTNTPFKFGLSSDSGALKQGTSGEDMGTLLSTLIISANDIDINGIKFDGQDSYNNAFYQIATRTGIIIKWCDIFDYQGIAVDYFGTASTSSEVRNTKIFRNGNGINSAHSNNIIEDSLIFKNSDFGIFSDKLDTLINHNVLFGNGTGLKLSDSTSGTIIKNTIFNSNSVFGITSDVIIGIAFCCITDAVDSNVNITASTNITDNPLLVNTTEGVEDFNIKTVEAGFVIESPCKDAGESDIGAFTLDRSLVSNSWRGHQFTFNARNINWSNTGKGFRKFENAFGSRTDYAKGHKRSYNFKYPSKQFSNEVDRKKIEFLLTLIQTEENGRPASDAIMRVSFLPDQGLDSGTAATFDATLKTITDSGQDLVENELKGFHVTQQYDKGTAEATISAAGKTVTISPSPTFTVNEHAQRFIFIQNNFFLILSNTATVLTVSDPNGDLSNASGLDWNVENYFKILSNENTVITLTDDDSLLVSGTFDYIVRFIECKPITNKFKYSQARYFYQQETWKTGYSFDLEEA